MLKKILTLLIILFLLNGCMLSSNSKETIYRNKCSMLFRWGFKLYGSLNGFTPSSVIYKNGYRATFKRIDSDSDQEIEIYINKKDTGSYTRRAIDNVFYVRYWSGRNWYESPSHVGMLNITKWSGNACAGSLNIQLLIRGTVGTESVYGSLIINRKKS